MVEVQQREAKDPNAALKAEAKALMTQRDALEQELAVATARLDASGAGLQGRLVDSEVCLAARLSTSRPNMVHVLLT